MARITKTITSMTSGGLGISTALSSNVTAKLFNFGLQSVCEQTSVRFHLTYIHLLYGSI